MSTNKKSGSIAALLTKYYLAFTVALAAAFAGIYLFWLNSGTDLFFTKNYTNLTDDPAFMEGRYRSIDLEKYLGKDGAFAVFGQNAGLLYASRGFLPLIRTLDELLCIPEYDGWEPFFELSRFETQSGEQRTILSRYADLGMDSFHTEVILLDGNNQVIANDLHNGKTSYTETELSFLTGQWSSQYELFRHESSDKYGNPVTVVFQFRLPTEEDYQKTSEKANRTWFLLLPLYALIALLFVVFLDLQIRKPLQKLGDSIKQFGKGSPASAKNCGGPLEIQKLGEIFDNLAEQLSESERSRETLEKQRQKMITDISHDLRTPITVIAGYANAIRDGKAKPEEFPKYLDAIIQKTTVLSELAESFYEYSKTNHPDFHPQKLATDICEFLRVYLAEKYDEIELAGFSLDVDIPEERIVCMIDALLMRRALDNLLSNSLRHNPKSTTIFACLKDEKEKDGVILSLGDDGQGIPKSMRADIFSPFVVGSESRNSGGSGLGLAISQKIIQAHDGEIVLSASPAWGSGTEFQIFLKKM